LIRPSGGRGPALQPYDDTRRGPGDKLPHSKPIEIDLAARPSWRKSCKA
jgi:hypothetical protein